MSKQLFLIVLALTLGIISCKNKGEYSYTSDGELDLVAIKMKKEGLIKVRVAFSKYDEALDVQKFTTAMQYQVDSCFYLSQEGRKTYPLYITPIANGLDKTFEYIVGFEKADLKSGTLVFVDRHRSKKNIELTFK